MAAVFSLPKKAPSLGESESNVAEAERGVSEEEEYLHRLAEELEAHAKNLRQRLQVLKTEMEGPGGTSNISDAHMAAANLAMPDVDFARHRQAAINARRSVVATRCRLNIELEREIRLHSSALRNIETRLRDPALVGIASDAPPAEYPVASAKVEVEVESATVQTPAIPSVPSDRRRSKRARVFATVVFNVEDIVFTGYTNDISSDGAFIATVHTRPLGSRLDISIQLPNGDIMNTEAVVRRVRPWNPAVPFVHPGMGVEFVGDTTGREPLNDFMQARGGFFVVP